MSDVSAKETVLRMALSVIHLIESHPDQSRQQRLDSVTRLLSEHLQRAAGESGDTHHGAFCSVCLQPFMEMSMAGRRFRSVTCGCSGLSWN